MPQMRAADRNRATANGHLRGDLQICHYVGLINIKGVVERKVSFR